ncbi:hypothetical protein RFI_29520 [Reticulomyxa filosa]|uniref:Uncharacterized protein n=1 Tax=Reticulomyxa filosa TaxID=46433 RepID=X6M341_RETFI|nr:hypothetical protein RFI_29520 [Reticulomyxa filosa]|eukprot:ETO07872.1 hypothetical protein RFI_29520 [Reticulomyxa filosa]
MAKYDQNIQNELNLLAKYQQQLKEAKEQRKTQQDEVQKNLDNTFQVLRRKLRKQEKELKNLIEKLYNDSEKDLCVFEKELTTCQNQLQEKGSTASTLSQLDTAVLTKNPFEKYFEHQKKIQSVNHKHIQKKKKKQEGGKGARRGTKKEFFFTWDKNSI